MKGGKAILILQAWKRKKKKYEIERVRLRVKKKVSERKKEKRNTIERQIHETIKDTNRHSKSKNEEGKK